MSRKRRKNSYLNKSFSQNSAGKTGAPGSLPSGVDEIRLNLTQKSIKKLKKKLYWYAGGLITVLALLAFCFLFLDSAHRVTTSPDQNVLLITLDTTRADRIGCYGYALADTPNLDKLASDGVRFINAYCPAPLTLPSHCSLLTGTTPLFHRVRNNGFYYLQGDQTTLAEVLKEKGFQTAAFVSSFTLDSRFGVDQGFDVFDDHFLEEGATKNFMSERRAEKTYSAFSQWFDSWSGKKFFCWVHFYDPHLPYNPPSPYKEKYVKRPYDGEIAYMDYYIGRTIDKLREKGVLDSTLVILIGDHGEALGEKNEIDHGLYIYNVTTRVPLIIYAPAFLPRGLALESQVRLIDVMPTICDLLEIPIPINVQGTSLLPYLEGRKKNDLPVYIETYMPREYYGWSELLGFIDGDWKFIRAPKSELYNIEEDPSEVNNLIAEKADTASNLGKKLEAFIKEHSSSQGLGKRTLSSEEQERLRSLGYIGGLVEVDESLEDLPDPKDKVDEYSIFAHARKYEYEENFELAERNYKELLKLNPDSPWNYVYLALLYERIDRLDDSLRILEQGRRRLPDSLVVLSRLSLFYMKKMKPKEAFETSQTVLRIDPLYFDALYSSAIALANMGRWKEALGYFEKVLEIEPENKLIRIQYAYCLYALNRAEEALQVYLKLLDEHPNDPIIYREIGILYDSMGELDKACESLKKAVEIDPSPNAYYNYAVALEKNGNLKEAIRYLKLYLETTREGDAETKANALKALAQWEARLRRQLKPELSAEKAKHWP